MMKKHKLLVLLALLSFTTSAMVSCNNGEENNNSSQDSTSLTDSVTSSSPTLSEGPDKTYVEQKFYDQVDAPDGWEYSKKFTFYDNDNVSVGTKMLKMNRSGDYLISKEFSADCNIHVAIFLALNGTERVMKQGELLFTVQALDADKNVISEQSLTHSEQFPNSTDRGNVVFDLPNEGKTIKFVKIIYAKKASTFGLNIGIGKVKIYSGAGSESLIVDDDDYVSNVSMVNNVEKAVPERTVATGSTLEDYSNASKSLSLKSTGERKLLVIPIQFQDVKFEDEDQARHDIEASFFGTEDEVGWESVSSFYYKSSYGYLNITGRVTKPFTLPCTTSELLHMNYGNNSWFALRESIEWYKQTYDDIDDYDSDGDGYIDSVWMVYAQNNCNYSKTGVCSDNSDNTHLPSDLYWAFVHRDYTVQPNFSSPNAYCYGWASYDFMYEGGYDKPDAHTFIHETGHILGLPDYYNYDRDGRNDMYSPAGKVDMMDNNIVDHNAYSKFLLNWVEPQVVKDNTTSLTIRPFESSGDCILVPNESFKDNPFAEYLMIEFYTPTGLNQLDSEVPYAKYNFKAMDTIGIKIYHVDSRLAILRANSQSNSYELGRYTDQVVFGLADGQGLGFAHENSTTRENYDGFRKLHLLEADESNSFFRDQPATNSSLFKLNDDFGVTKFEDFKFNDGKDLKWTFTITAMSDESTTITFTKK